MVDRYAWTSLDSGDGKGTVYVMGGLAPDCRLLDNPPFPYQDFNWALRYDYDHVTNTWSLKVDALPATTPEDFRAWDYSERYEVDTTDPLRNSWVLKPDAKPVEQPETEPQERK